MQAKRKIPAILGLLAGAFTWGVIWYPYRLFQDAGLSGEMASFLTYGVALLVGLPVLGRRLRGHCAPRRALLWIGLAAGWTNLAYVLAVIHGEVMRVLLLFYLAPLWTVLFARFLLGEKLNGYGYVVVGLSLAGAAVMLMNPAQGWPVPENAAEWIGLSAGVAFALTNVLSRKAHEHDIAVKSLAVWVGVCVLALIPATGGTQFSALASLSLSVWGGVILVGLVLFGVTLAVQYGLTHVPANQAIVILLSELVVAALSSYFLVHEQMTAREWIGGAMIAAASFLSGKLEGARG